MNYKLYQIHLTEAEHNLIKSRREKEVFDRLEAATIEYQIAVPGRRNCRRASPRQGGPTNIRNLGRVNKARAGLRPGFVRTRIAGEGML